MMSVVVGFDFGNESCVVAVARQGGGGIDVVLDETPAVVCFGDKQRFLGTAGAAASSFMNPENTISQIKRIVGRQFSDTELQRDLRSLPCLVTEGSDGYPLIHARYLGEMKTFTPTQVLGMVLSHLKVIAEKNLNAGGFVVDCCIGVPVYFSDLQRRAVLDAATIAGLPPPRLIHETTATALAYGIYKTDLPDNEPINVAFIDVGHASTQVCIAAFKKGQLKILAHSFDRSLGGRDFDEALFQHFAAKFKDEYTIDVHQSARACLLLRADCEKLKKVLSANAEASLNIDCLMEDKDVRGFIKRDEFEQISVPILEQLKQPLEKALVDAGLTIDNIHSVEVVGSGSRVPAITKILTEFFGKEPARTMNASRSVAKGCALQCAMLGPAFKVPGFQVNESFPFPIALSWKVSSSDEHDGEMDSQQSTVAFWKGDPIPSLKALTFYRSGTFIIDVQYADVSELRAPAKISTYTIGPFQSTNSERAKLKVNVCLNLHAIVSVESATLLEEEETDVPVVREPANESTKMKTDEASAETDGIMQDAKHDGTGVAKGVPELGDKRTNVEMDSKVVATKKNVKITNIPVSEVVHGGLVAEDVQKAVEKEFEMALQDRVMEETKDKKNAFEAYVYDMRNKLHDRYIEFVTGPEREQFTASLQEVENWLSEDGEDETKGVYIAKLEELKKQGDPIEERYKEQSEKGSVIDQLTYCINNYREAAISSDPKFDHIELAEKQKVLNECVEAESWLREKKQQQDALPKSCRPITMKPKPAAPLLSSSQGEESQRQADNTSSSHNKNTNKNDTAEYGEGVPAPMETEDKFEILRNNQNDFNIYRQDVVRSKKWKKLGTVTSFWGDSEGETDDNFVRVLWEEGDDTYDILNENFVRVLWEEGDDTYDILNDLTVIDRGFKPGAYVAAVSDPSGQAGIVMDVDKIVDLKAPDGSILKDVSCRDLKCIREFVDRDHVVLGQWLGRVKEVSDDVTVELDNGTVIELTGADLKLLKSIGKNIHRNMRFPYYPGQLVELSSSDVFEELHGTISKVTVGSVFVDWLESASGGWSRPHNKLESTENLKVLSCFAHSNWKLGDWCLLDKKVENFERGLLIINSKTQVDVVWQDGTVNRVESTSLITIDISEDPILVAEQYVVENEGVNRRVGVVKNVDAKGRTAYVRWLKPGTENRIDFDNEEVVSLYEIEAHPDHCYCYGDVVVQLPVESINDDEMQFGIIAGLKDCKVKVEWADGMISTVDPRQIRRVALSDSTDGYTSSYYSSGSDSIESIDNASEEGGTVNVDDVRRALKIEGAPHCDFISTFKSFDIVGDPSDHSFLDKQHCADVAKAWLKKVQHDWNILQKDLPEGIYVRAYEDRMDLLRAMIPGAYGTPYHDGLFFFDFHLPPKYPYAPPSVYFHSRGWRLNPNLYEDGKVCLSLLNTWAGGESEVWDPTQSSVLQVLVSLQGLVLNARPYFNEAGYDGRVGTAEGEKDSLSYNENIFLLNCKMMMFLIEKPPKDFRELITEHFKKRGCYVLKACDAYKNGNLIGSLTKDGCISSGNTADSNSAGFKLALDKIVPKLFSALSGIGADCEEYKHLIQ